MLRRIFRSVFELYDGYMNFGKAELEQIKKLQEQQKKELELAKRLNAGFDAKSEDMRMEALRLSMQTLQDAEKGMSAAEQQASLKLKEILDKAVPDPTALSMEEMQKKLASEKSIGEFLSQAQQKIKEEKSKRQE